MFDKCSCGCWDKSKWVPCKLGCGDLGFPKQPGIYNDIGNEDFYICTYCYSKRLDENIADLDRAREYFKQNPKQLLGYKPSNVEVDNTNLATHNAVRITQGA